MFLANENFPKPSIDILRNKGFLVTSIQEQMPGISDKDVIEIAVKENLIILTFDKDYGEIIFKHAAKSPPAVIFFREKGSSPQFAATILLSIINSQNIQFQNSFTVIERQNIRQRFY